jgi:hypothetical protein
MVAVDAAVPEWFLIFFLGGFGLAWFGMLFWEVVRPMKVTSERLEARGWDQLVQFACRGNQWALRQGDEALAAAYAELSIVAASLREQHLRRDREAH